MEARSASSTSVAAAFSLTTLVSFTCLTLKMKAPTWRWVFMLLIQRRKMEAGVVAINSFFDVPGWMQLMPGWLHLLLLATSMDVLWTPLWGMPPLRTNYTQS